MLRNHHGRRDPAARTPDGRPGCARYNSHYGGCVYYERHRGCTRSRIQCENESLSGHDGGLGHGDDRGDGRGHSHDGHGHEDHGSSHPP